MYLNIQIFGNLKNICNHWSYLTLFNILKTLSTVSKSLLENAYSSFLYKNYKVLNDIFSIFYETDDDRLWEIVTWGLLLSAIGLAFLAIGFYSIFYLTAYFFIYILVYSCLFPWTFDSWFSA